LIASIVSGCAPSGRSCSASTLGSPAGNRWCAPRPRRRAGRRARPLRARGSAQARCPDTVRGRAAPRPCMRASRRGAGSRPRSAIETRAVAGRAAGQTWATRFEWRIYAAFRFGQLEHGYGLWPGAHWLRAMGRRRSALRPRPGYARRLRLPRQHAPHDRERVLRPPMIRRSVGEEHRRARIRVLELPVPAGAQGRRPALALGGADQFLGRQGPLPDPVLGTALM
jgi:hypothetical protein